MRRTNSGTSSDFLESMSIHTASSVGVRSLIDEYDDDDYDNDDEHSIGEESRMYYRQSDYNVYCTNTNTNSNINDSSNTASAKKYNTRDNINKAHTHKPKMLSPLHEQQNSSMEDYEESNLESGYNNLHAYNRADDDIVNNIAAWQTLIQDYKQFTNNKNNELEEQQHGQERRHFLKSSSSSSSISSFQKENTLPLHTTGRPTGINNNNKMNNRHNSGNHNHQIQELKQQNTFDSTTFQSETTNSDFTSPSIISQQNHNQFKKINNETLILNPSSTGTSTKALSSHSHNLIVSPPPHQLQQQSQLQQLSNPHFQTSQKFKNILNNVHFKNIVPMSLSKTHHGNPHHHPTQTIPSSKSTPSSSTTTTAATFAKNAPYAGYLNKLGGSVTEYKRRFFVLKPTTCLYYFLSPNDTEPRGCIDLDDGAYLNDHEDDYFGGDEDNDNDEHVLGRTKDDEHSLRVNSKGCLPDGRFRFEIVLPIPNKSTTNNTTNNHDPPNQSPKRRKIILEARNEQIGKEWMNSIITQRLSHSKYEKRQLVSKIQILNDEKKKLEQRIEEFRLVEDDRDGAIKDAQEWKRKMEQLDHALNVLKRWMSKPPSCDNDDHRHHGDSFNTTNNSENHNQNNAFEASISLSIGEDDDLQLEEVKHPDTNFASLVNVCRGVRETLRLTSTEANVVVEDLNKANEKINALSSRMVKAEKYLCKLWEENCTIRDDLKKKKSERKVLVKEVKSLLEKSKEDQDVIEKLKAENESLRCRVAEGECNSSDNSSTHEEKKNYNKHKRLSAQDRELLREIEDGIDSGLNLWNQSHDRRESNESPIMKERNDLSCIVEETNLETISPSENSTPTVSNAAERKRGYRDHLPHTLFEPREGNSSESEDSDVHCKPMKRTFSPLRPKSLLDQIAIQEKQEIQKIKDMNASDPDMNNVEIPLNLSELSHPLNKIDNDSATEPSELSLKSLVTDNVEATSRLSCPLLDVKQGKVAQDSRSVYHLTFYSSKIGLQFQRVPNKVASTGLLTDAMTIDDEIDVKESATASSRTDSELKMIASMYNSSSTSTKDNTILKDKHCPVIFPKDIVLVCGFNGFDETANSNKPSLGARLIAFDGISIERGPWTFDTVRKAIKACERPLTLSFRDDFLTTEQRIILTKAASEVADNNAQRPTQPRQGIPRIINAKRKDIFNHVQEQSLALTNNFTNNYEIHDDSDVDYGSVLTSDMKSQSSETWRTFSDAGSSSVFSTKFAPLMAGFVSKMKEEQKLPTFTPDYFRRDPNSLERIPHHMEFKSGLL